ncbi:MAG: biotin--[acetyl-CoA-carboxylase] ligase [Acetobacter fabarum]|jgi:BirA family biotin operon repressor/biotin-[acetyl-CoA-carboxylase] ligase|uniref:biotin--[acetyl-CoA-carboxylase] ligase n=1 Tax=Acetobacter fabarum TaxID=483199 RepID=UPI00242CDD0D|nr:biotin--[acetyl-CoA-carboxylase] ligase [Acetobacter fabarum]MCH4026343.1 biotin--[acetyl-CoA-carboxylase] ligase [Acetobacter fabarum]MCH4056294.1 biotin--[acetyl-CoA-carboxylase] ligase [Acetobacter fabarum]MCH4085795.1 biotin--[acetyl-CoA-carboxylase] ligase [Acetobacter fabarum]MCH4127613.1 biotin--[acetyl-CoA-carboxylase] ligase [Acetobacter fabarum]MCH4136962.1 biotin--[acetyl-CoA-carboxylase] ligase [Acetobacter fabarum]
MSGQGDFWRLTCFDELPSTSDYCLNACRSGDPVAGLAVLARRQTKGRGSRGRTWLDGGQGLALSVVLDGTQAGPEALGGWPFVASLGFYDGLLRAQPAAQPHLMIKWPNDILLDGRKMGGILIEREGPYVLVGLGANLVSAPDPDVLERTVACLAQCGPVPDVDVVARHVLDGLTFWSEQWRQKGFASIRAAWLERAHPVGTPLVVQGGTTYEKGLFAGLAPDGRLLLDTEGGMKTIATGDILLMEKGA